MMQVSFVFVEYPVNNPQLMTETRHTILVLRVVEISI